MKITLIGSTRRFKNLFIKANREFSAAGHVVYSQSCFNDHEAIPPTLEELVILDLVGLKKISESEAVIVVCDDSGYVGESTRRELAWAFMEAKAIYWLPDITPQDLVGDVPSFMRIYGLSLP